MDERKELIKENFTAARAELAALEERYGRKVTLVAATKTVSAEDINYAIDRLGLTDIGENRVQELLGKYDALHKDGVNIHFIGQLQKNKVKYIIDKVCMIQSLDSLSLAEEIEKQAAKHGKVMDVLIEINSGREENKGGILPEKLADFLDAIAPFSHLRVRGLMTVAPNLDEKAKLSVYFSETFQIFIDILLKKIHNIYEPILSMGMSDSYPYAVAAGANMVRLGSVLFGKRR